MRFVCVCVCARESLRERETDEFHRLLVLCHLMEYTPFIYKVCLCVCASERGRERECVRDEFHWLLVLCHLMEYTTAYVRFVCVCACIHKVCVCVCARERE